MEVFVSVKPDRKMVVRIVGKASRVPHHNNKNGYDRYYYDAEVKGKPKILSVGAKAQEVIKANWPEHEWFEFSKSGGEHRCCVTEERYEPERV